MTTPQGLLIGVDIGTTSVKAGAFTADGTLLALASTTYPTRRPRPGWAEQDPDDWWVALQVVLAELNGTVPLIHARGIGVCSQVNTHLLVDDRGVAITPAITWHDQRCVDVAASMDAALTADERHRLWGSPFAIDASFSLARVRWLRENQPQELDRARWLLAPKDYMNLRLTGVAATDPMSPVGLVGPDGAYIDGVLSLVDGAARLMPPIRQPTMPLGSPVAAELGLSAQCVVVSASMDAWGSVYGSGIASHGMAMDVGGTSEIVAVASRFATRVPGVVTFAPVGGLYVHAGPTQCGGDVLRWMAEINHVSVSQVLQEAGEVRPGAHGIVFLPYLKGERAPLWDPSLRGALVGLSSDHVRGDIASALLEGVAFSVRHLLEEEERAALVRPDHIVSSGGGAQSDLWCQIKADVLGRPLHRLAVVQSGLTGAAMFAGVGAEVFDDLATATSAMVKTSRVFSPVHQQTAVYEELYGIYRELPAPLAPTHAWLNRFRAAHS